MNRRFSGLSRREFLSLAGATVCALPTGAAWAVPGARAGKLRFAFFTDVHARTEWQTPLGMMAAAEAINARNPELIVAGGDLITDGFQSGAKVVEHRWDAYLEMHRSMRAPVEAVIGNHDLVAAIPEDGSPASPDPREIFRTRLGLSRSYRSFEADGYHFFLLDSIFVTGGELKYEGRVDEAQLEWLRGEVEKLDPEAPIVLATHIPLVTAMYQVTEGAATSARANRVVVNNREVLEIFDRHNLLLVLQGHLHVDEMIRWRGTTFITGGAVCGKWWRGSWHGTPEGFGVVTLKRGRVEWEYHSYGWVAKRP
jgi:3',5'-cyclic AMP phosphodiesterase CpdA